MRIISLLSAVLGDAVAMPQHRRLNREARFA